MDTLVAVAVEASPLTLRHRDTLVHVLAGVLDGLPADAHSTLVVCGEGGPRTLHVGPASGVPLSLSSAPARLFKGRCPSHAEVLGGALHNAALLAGRECAVHVVLVAAEPCRLLGDAAIASVASATLITRGGGTTVAEALSALLPAFEHTPAGDSHGWRVVSHGRPAPQKAPQRANTAHPSHLHAHHQNADTHPPAEDATLVGLVRAFVAEACAMPPDARAAAVRAQLESPALSQAYKALLRAYVPAIAAHTGGRTEPAPLVRAQAARPLWAGRITVPGRSAAAVRSGIEAAAYALANPRAAPNAPGAAEYDAARWPAVLALSSVIDAASSVVVQCVPVARLVDIVHAGVPGEHDGVAALRAKLASRRAAGVVRLAPSLVMVLVPRGSQLLGLVVSREAVAALGRRPSHPSAHPSANPSMYPSAQSSMNPSAHSSVHPSMYSSAHPSNHSSVHSSAHPSNHSSAHPSNHSSAHPSAQARQTPVRHGRAEPRATPQGAVMTPDEILRAANRVREPPSSQGDVFGTAFDGPPLTSVDDMSAHAASLPADDLFADL